MPNSSVTATLPNITVSLFGCRVILRQSVGPGLHGTARGGIEENCGFGSIVCSAMSALVTETHRALTHKVLFAHFGGSVEQ